MKPRLSLLLGCVALAGALRADTPAGAPLPPARPNLILLLTDDQRWDSLRAVGDPGLQTPNLDALAAQGRLFQNNFATTPICAASRASIFTGQYERRHGIVDFRATLRPERWAETYPLLLRAAGYHTGFVGKFGVGGRAAVQARAADFDYWRGVTGQGGNRFIDPKDPDRVHATARQGDQALEFLRSAPADRPFCLSVSFLAPHARDDQPREFEPDHRDESLYHDTVFARPPTVAGEYFDRLPDFVRRSEARRRWQNRFSTEEQAQATLRDYHRLVAGIDREVGRLRAELQKLGRADDTVILFTSDHGFALGDRGLSDKWFMYEESIRSPLVILDPRLPEALRGRPVDALALNIDLAPTLLDYAGLPAPPAMQGRTLRPLLESTSPPADWRQEFFLEHHYAAEIIPPSEAVRTTRWTYIRWLSPNLEQEELYDLEADPLQSRNLAADPAFQDVLARLRSAHAGYTHSLR